MKPTSIALSLLLLAACGGGGSVDLSGGGPITPFPDQAMGGAWSGTDNNGLQVFALSTDSGRLHWVVPSTGEQGFGTGSVSALSVTINYTYVAPFGFTLPDGSNSATCSGGGTIEERVSFYSDVICTTTLGGSFNNTATLNYDSLYDRDSSLALIAGNYDDFGLTINVTASGQVFEQDPASGCVINGQISIIDSQYNAYDVSITYSNCLGTAAVLNGSTFSGLGILDNTVAPEVAIIGLTGDVGSETYSVVYSLPRL